MRYANLNAVAPATLSEAVTLLNAKMGGYKLLAGGTDFMVELASGKQHVGDILSLHRICELNGVQIDGDFVIIGALTSFREILKHAIVAKEFPNLHQAARWVGATAIQNRATIGGNIGNASPAADSPPALLCYNAEIELASVRGNRWLRYSDFHTGYKTTAAAPDEMISRVRLPRDTAGLKHYYRKVGARKALAISKISIAACARMRGSYVEDIRIGLGSVAPTVVRATQVEQLLLKHDLSAVAVLNARLALVNWLKPITDIRSTAEYRSTVAENILAEFLESLF
jgi:CO/xanthine dehydrogenase FAD-binding subunit